ncbi:unnamed protein product [Peniophora sp. CBMAI 1063]|nr:unnamed protein product [Peniophora sp. CBMAI 1063]
MSTPTATSPVTDDSGDNNSTKLIIIIVSCLGGFLFVFGLVCIIVPILRRRVARRGPRRDFEDASNPGAHARHASEAGAPLLYSKELQGHDRDLSASSTGHGLVIDGEYHSTPESTYYDAYNDSTPEPTANFAYTPYATDSPPMPQRPPPPRQPQPLKHARTRIRAPMAPVPEDGLPPTPKSTRRTSIPTASPPSSPPPQSQSEEHPSWLHIPTAGPLISAFRRSIAASTSTGKTSMTGQSHNQSSVVPPLPTSHLDHTSSIEALTIRSFTSGAESGHEIAAPPPRDVPARLRPSGGPERVAQLVVPRHTELTAPGSRAASLLSAPLSNTGASSRSGVSVYTDARSDLGGASELGERSLRSNPSRP